jgi:hypothetical protein
MSRITAPELNNVLANFYDKWWRHPAAGWARRHVHISFDTLTKLTGIPTEDLIGMLATEQDNFQHVFGFVKGRRVLVMVAKGEMTPISQYYYHSEAFRKQTYHSRIL